MCRCDGCPAPGTSQEFQGADDAERAYRAASIRSVGLHPSGSPPRGREDDTFKDVAEKTRADVDKAATSDSIAGTMKTILKREKRDLCRNA